MYGILIVPSQIQAQTGQWNRYVTPNFEILSLDDHQGKLLCDNIEHMKTWILTRYQLPDINFPKKCFVVLVPTTELQQKLFNITESTYKFQENRGMIWIVTINRWQGNELIYYISHVCLDYFERQHQYEFPLIIRYGMCQINQSKSQILNILQYTDFSILSKSYQSLTVQEKLQYNALCGLFVLYIVKQKGLNDFHRILNDKSLDVQKYTNELQQFREFLIKNQQWSNFTW